MDPAVAELSDMTVVVAGAAGAMGAHVADRLAANVNVGRLIGIDRRQADGVERFDLLDSDLADLVSSADVLVHLAATPMGNSSDGEDASTDKLLAQRTLEAATSVGVRHVVIMSSTMVYGAWPDNPLPLTEACLLYTSPSPRDRTRSRMPSSA